MARIGSPAAQFLRITLDRGWALAVVAFGAAISFWPGILSAATAPRWWVLAAGLPLASRLDPRQADLRVLAPFLAVVAYAALSLLWAPDPLSGTNDLIHLLILLAAVLAGASGTNLTPVMAALSVGVAVSAALSIGQVLGWSPVGQLIPPAGLFLNRMILGETIAPLLVWALCTPRWRLLAPLLAVGLLASQSRVGLCAVVIALAARYPKRAALLFIPAMLYLNVALSYHWGFFAPEKLASFSDRLMIWRLAIHDLTWAGHGIGAFGFLHPWFEYAHSDLLQAVYELGPAAILLAAAFLVCLRGPRTAEWAAFVAVGIEAAVSFPLHMPVSAFVGAFLAGALARPRPLVRPAGFRGRTSIVAGA